MSLVKGQSYYLEGRQVESSGSDHLSVAVEIEDNANAKTHHHAMRQIQEMQVSTTQEFEKTKFTIEGGNSGNFKIIYTNPKTQKVNVTDTLKDDMTADEFKNGVKGYYAIHGTEINVIKESLDVNGVATADPLLAVKHVYTVSLLKLINGQSTDGIQIAPMGTNAQITFEAPENVQLSKPPLEGHFIIQCKTLGGQVSFTEEIAVGASWLTVENRIN